MSHLVERDGVHLCLMMLICCFSVAEDVVSPDSPSLPLEVDVISGAPCNTFECSPLAVVSGCYWCLSLLFLESFRVRYFCRESN